ncbi:hypothetical protein FO519_004106 [Halicephalobus sp. NKZ332]|nr:hypothetical protein FO519_004106 [Halicephalobus sp. NKZ332]
MQKSEDTNIPFDHYSPEFRCCCGSVHVKQGTQIIGVLQLVLAIFSCVALLFATELDPVWGFLEIASLLVEVAVLILLFIGLRKEDSRYLLPYLVYEGIWILISIMVTILSFFAFLNPQSDIGHIIRGQLVEIAVLDKKGEEMDNSLIRLSALFTILSFIIGAIVSIWWIYVVSKCYNYFKRLAEYREKTDVTVKYSSRTV